MYLYSMMGFPLFSRHFDNFEDVPVGVSLKTFQKLKKLRGWKCIDEESIDLYLIFNTIKMSKKLE